MLQSDESFMEVGLPPLTNPFVAIAEVDSPVIVVTTVAIPITKTDRPFEKKRGKKVEVLKCTRISLANTTNSQNWINVLFNWPGQNCILELQGNTCLLQIKRFPVV